jgi:TRAP-type mannitol/chloroaromatic compound transport system substrate-binding protein
MAGRRGQRSPADPMTDNKFQIQVFSAGEIVPTFQPSAKFELTINQNKIVGAMPVSDTCQFGL